MHPVVEAAREFIEEQKLIAQDITPKDLTEEQARTTIHDIVGCLVCGLVFNATYPDGIAQLKCPRCQEEITI